MKKSLEDSNQPNSNKNRKRFSILTVFCLSAAIVAFAVGTSVLSQSQQAQMSAPNPPSRSQDNKKYVATREITVDRETGKLRKPTAEETKELVDSLKAMTKRSSENLKSSSLSNGVKRVKLDGGFGGTMLARPGTDGTFETRCVFTFEEATSFLGLVEDNSYGKED